jgi:hypothetical protein
MSLPKISMTEWLEAERASTKDRFEPQPKGSLTVEQYAKARVLSYSRAQTVLSLLCHTGHASRKRWYDGRSGTRMVYWLKPKKEWPKK